MATITATPEPQYGCIRLEIAAEPGDTQIIGVSRMGIDGAGQDVRTRDGQLPAAFPLLLRDYEAPFSRPSQYLLSYAGAEPLALEFSNEVTLTPPAGVGGVLTVVGQPAIQVHLPMVLTFDAANAQQVTVHWLMNAEAPRYSIGPVRSRVGMYSTVLADYDDVRQALNVYDQRQPVLLRQTDHPGMDVYHVATNTRHRAADPHGREWVLEVEFVEIAFPSMPLVGATGWTYDTVSITYEDYTEVITTYASYADLFIGPLS